MSSGAFGYTPGQKYKTTLKNEEKNKCYRRNMFTNHIYLIYLYKQDVTLKKNNDG